MSEWGDVVEEALLGHLAGLAPAGSARAPAVTAAGASLAGDAGLALFDAQAASRHLDHAARWLRSTGPRLLHDRLVRPRGQRRRRRRAAADRPGAAALPLAAGSTWPGPSRCPGTTASRDVLLGHAGVVPTSRSPAAATRCSATPTWPSSRRRRRSPRTCRGRSAWRSPSAGPAGSASPIALARRRGRRVQLRRRLGRTTRRRQGAINAAVLHRPPGPAAAAAVRVRGQRVGISVPTPPGWVEASLGHRPGLRYEQVDGTDPGRRVRRRRASSPSGSGPTRRPAFLHLRTVRFGGHAGTDVEAAYRPPAEIRGRPRLATRCSAPPAARRRRRGDAGRAGRALPRRSAPTCAARPIELLDRPTLTHGRRGDRAARAPHARRPWPPRVAPSAGPTRGRRSSAGCPRTRAR